MQGAESTESVRRMVEWIYMLLLTAIVLTCWQGPDQSSGGFKREEWAVASVDRRAVALSDCMYSVTSLLREKKVSFLTQKEPLGSLGQISVFYVRCHKSMAEALHRQIVADGANRGYAGLLIGNVYRRTGKELVLK